MVDGGWWMVDGGRITGSFDDLCHEIEETAAVLLGFDRRYAVDVRSVLDRLGRFGRLFFDPVVRQNVYQGQEIDLPSRVI